MTHPCLTCGACCASFRVGFSVHETQEMGGDVPDGLVVEVTGATGRWHVNAAASGAVTHSPNARALPRRQAQCAWAGKGGSPWRMRARSQAWLPAANSRQGEGRHS